MPRAQLPGKQAHAARLLLRLQHQRADRAWRLHEGVGNLGIARRKKCCEQHQRTQHGVQVRAFAEYGTQGTSDIVATVQSSEAPSVPLSLDP